MEQPIIQEKEIRKACALLDRVAQESLIPSDVLLRVLWSRLVLAWMLQEEGGKRFTFYLCQLEHLMAEIDILVRSVDSVLKGEEPQA